MPFYKHEGQLIFFAHVPKCAGTSVTEYLEERFGKPAFEDRAFRRSPALFPWTKTSPQHVTVAALERVVPLDFFDHKIAVVRHPIPRLLSVFHFQKRNQKQIGKLVSFERWLKSLPTVLASDPYRFDGHTMPQSVFVPDEAKVFRLEDGLDALKIYLDECFGPTSSEKRFGHAKKTRSHLKLKPIHEELIREIYAEDFARFGYK